MNNKDIKDILSDNLKKITEDNNFLFISFENRLLLRITHIFEKQHISFNSNIIKKYLDEYLINNLISSNSDILLKYNDILLKYNQIIVSYIQNKTDVNIIKKATLQFIDKLSNCNKENHYIELTNNFMEYIMSVIYVYDNASLISDIRSRISLDTKEIITECNKNNYNYFISSLNDIIKKLIVTIK